MISVRNLSIRFGDLEVLQDISFSLQRGECLLVTGPSGCGKSTLARVLTGLIPQAIFATLDGKVEVAGLDVSISPISESAQRVGAVFQNPRSQLFHLRVADEVAFGPYNLNLAKEEIDARVAWALGAVGLSDFRDHNPALLSGGEAQRVAIAAALAMRPKVLVLDEPTSSLDVLSTTSIINALEKLRADYGLTIVIIEHRLAEVRRLVDRVIILDEGRKMEEGTFREVMGHQDGWFHFGLRRLPQNPLKAWDELLVPNRKIQPNSAPLLEFKEVTAGYNGTDAIQKINLGLHHGEFVALVGNNGAGKTTLALTAAGLMRPKSGRIVFDNHTRPRPGRDIALLFQNPVDQLLTNSVDEEVAFGPQNYRCFDPDWHDQNLLKADLLALRNRSTANLSMGQQQRTVLAACLSLRPRLLILDEPTLGQDWQHLEQLMDFLVQLNHQGMTILLITHDYKLVHRYARRVVLMEAGRIVLDGKIDPIAQRVETSSGEQKETYVRA